MPDTTLPSRPRLRSSLFGGLREAFECWRVRRRILMSRLELRALDHQLILAEMWQRRVDTEESMHRYGWGWTGRPPPWPERPKWGRAGPRPEPIPSPPVDKAVVLIRPDDV